MPFIADTPLHQYNQPHLIEEFKTWSEQDQVYCLEQLQNYPPSLLAKQNETVEPPPSFDPIPQENIVETKGDLIPNETMGCLVLAGGQGTRLGFEGPKGAMPLTEDGHSLFSVLCEKVSAASEKSGHPHSIAIMTSPLNHEATVDYFEENNWFGLDPDQIDLFSQEMLPLMNQEGKWFFEAPGRLALAPDGNGKALQRFYHSGLHQKWREKGIKYLNVVPIDNVLAYPYDPDLFEILDTHATDLVLKCVARNNPQERVGILGVSEGNIIIQEYSEVSDEIRKCRSQEGGFLYPFANTGLFACSMDFIEKIEDRETVLHRAFRNKAWKSEYFIFDVFPYADSFRVTLSTRDQCFAPLKRVDDLPNITKTLLFFLK